MLFRTASIAIAGFFMSIHVNASIIPSAQYDIDTRGGNFSEKVVIQGPLVVGEEFLFQFRYRWEPIVRYVPPALPSGGSTFRSYDERASLVIDFGSGVTVSSNSSVDYDSGTYLMESTFVYNNAGLAPFSLNLTFEQRDIFIFKYSSTTNSSSTDFTDLVSCLSNIFFGCVSTTSTTTTTEINIMSEIQVVNKLVYQRQFNIFETSKPESTEPKQPSTVTVVPEPTTIIIFGLGLLGLAALSRKELSK